jgi:hypothetical protein
VNTTVPLTSLHVTAGAVTVSNATPDPGTIINAERANGNAFITIMGSAGQQRGLIFGESNNVAEAGIFYDNLGVSQMDFRTGGNVTRMGLGVSAITGGTPLTNLRLVSVEGGLGYMAAQGNGASATSISGSGEAFPTSSSLPTTRNSTGPSLSKTLWTSTPATSPCLMAMASSRRRRLGRAIRCTPEAPRGTA